MESLLRLITIVGLLLAMAWAGDTLRKSYHQGKLPKVQQIRKAIQTAVETTLKPESQSDKNINQSQAKQNFSEDLITELSMYPATQSVAQDRNVKALLDNENRNVELVMSRGNRSLRSQLIGGARSLVPVLSRCLSDGSRCGSDENWEDYFAVGGAPLHQALDRAMAVIKMATDQGEKFLVSREDLLAALRVPHHGIEVAAIDLLTTGPMNSKDFNEVLAVAPAVRGRARKLYYKMLGETLSVGGSEVDHRAYVKSIYSALGNDQDAWTRNHVISGLNGYGLSNNEFSQAVRLSCRHAGDTSGENTQLRMAETLTQKARRSGYNLPTKAICLNSQRPALVDR